MAAPQVNFVQLAGALFAVCLGSAVLLATVNSATKPIIEAKAKEKKAASRKGVLPTETARVDADEKSFLVNFSSDWAQNSSALAGIFSDSQEKDKAARVFRGYNAEDQVTGYVFSCQLPDGYSGAIDFLVGVNYDKDEGHFVVSGSTILKHAETPGLGANIEHISYSEKKAAKKEGRVPVPGFLQQYVNKSAQQMVLKKTDPKNGTLDALTAATITSKAYTQAMERVLAFCNRNTSLLLQGGNSDGKAE